MERELAPAKRRGRGKAPRPPKQIKQYRKTPAAVVRGEAASAVDTRVPIRPARSTGQSPSRRSGRSGRRLVRHPVHLIIGGGAVVILALVAVLVTNMMGGGSGAAHSISTPTLLNGYVLQPQLAQSMGAAGLRTDIVKKGNGEATNVKDAVYEVSTGPAAKSGPLFVLFIGGNLAGSASSFISSFTGLLPGAFVTSPGSLGGQAACVPGYAGHPAECAWADNDTFGLFASPDLSVTALRNELLAMRPLVEHVRK